MLKQIAVYRLASACDILSPWRAFLPTGADVITEEIYKINEITNEYGEPVELVYSGLG